MLMYYAFTPDSVFKSVQPKNWDLGSELTWQTSMLYSDIVLLIYVNETICMVICLSTRFKSIILRLGWLTCLVPRLSQNTSCGWGAWCHSLSFKTFLSFINRRLVTVSAQFSHWVLSDSLRSHESQHARPPCPSPTSGVHPNPCPSSWWCHPAISSSVVPFSSCPQSLLASESFPMSQLFASGGQSTGVSALASFLPKKSQGDLL